MIGEERALIHISRKRQRIWNEETKEMERAWAVIFQVFLLYLTLRII